MNAQKKKGKKTIVRRYNIFTIIIITVETIGEHRWA